MSTDSLRQDGGLRSWLALGGLAGLVAAVYWPVVGYEFVNWDDPWYVLKNPLITSWHPANLWRIATEMSVKNYAPLTTLSLLVDHTFFGLNAGGYHLVNVALHVVNTLLVCLLVSRLSGHRAIGLMTAALFAVHPVQVESVAWVSSRKTLLCSTFMLASAMCWLRPERSAKQECWGTGFLALALLAKAAAIVMPPIVVAYDLLIARKKPTESIPRQIIPAFLCILLLNVTMSAQSSYMGGVRSHMDLSKLQILGVDTHILWQYVGMLIVPANLSLLYDPQTTGLAVPIALSTIGWVLVGMIAWFWRKTRPGVAFALVCWFCLLAPVLNLFPITTLMNDRYLYLPCICFFGLVSAGGLRLMAWIGCFDGANDASESRASGVGTWRILANVGAAAVVAAAVCGYAWQSTQRLPVWRNDFALWSRTIRQVPQLAVVQIQWADSLRARGHDSAAAATLKLALAKCDPDAADRQRIQERLQSWRTEEHLATSYVSVLLPEAEDAEKND